MHTVAETSAYIASARRAGMTDEEMERAVNLIAANPAVGDLIVGSGGCRKVRIPGRGKGKSGGYRVVTYFWSEKAPVYLLAALSKGSSGNFSDAQVAAMSVAARQLAAELRKGVSR